MSPRKRLGHLELLFHRLILIVRIFGSNSGRWNASGLHFLFIITSRRSNLPKNLCFGTSLKQDGRALTSLADVDFGKDQEAQNEEDTKSDEDSKVLEY